MDKWQSMDSAPRDGSGVLLIDMTAERPEAGMGWWLFDTWTAIDPDGEPCFEEAFYKAMVWLSPTHWMPLPAPPPSGPRP